MRISDWSSDVCSSDLGSIGACGEIGFAAVTDHIQSGAEQAFIGWRICGDPVGCRTTGDVRFEPIIGGGVAILHSYAQRCVEPREEACILSALFPGALICWVALPALLDRQRGGSGGRAG